jgi:hypothetical protein
MAYHEIHVFSRLQYAMAFTFDNWVEYHLSSLPAVIYSFHQTLWPVILYLLIRFTRRDPRYFLALAAIFLGAYAVSAFTVDSTRVFTLLTWGATIHAIAHAFALNSREQTVEQANPLAGLLLIIAFSALIIPRFFVWGGAVIRTPGGPLALFGR